MLEAFLPLLWHPVFAPITALGVGWRYAGFIHACTLLYFIVHSSTVLRDAQKNKYGISIVAHAMS